MCVYIYIRFLQVDCNLKLQQCRTSSCSRMVSPIWTACWAISRASSCLPAWQNCCFACQESVAQAPANMLRANLAVSLQANRRTACSSPPPDFIEEAQVRSLQSCKYMSPTIPQHPLPVTRQHKEGSVPRHRPRQPSTPTTSGKKESSLNLHMILACWNLAL